MFFTNINKRVSELKDNPVRRNDFINEYKPFISSSVAKAIGHYVEYGKDEELSIGLIAFDEAIRCFEETKGNFLSFSQSVIRKRIIDYYRKQKKYSHEISLQAKINEDSENEVDLTLSKSMENYALETNNEMRKLELIQFKEELAKWEITFEDLVDASPKHEKLRETYKEIIYYVLCHKELAQTVLKKKYLPIAEIEKELKIPRKKIERGRRYIIASIIVLSGDYQYIREFVKWR